MPGLLRGLARTAAVAGTATAVHGKIKARQDAKRGVQTAPTTQQTPPPAAAAPPADPTSDRLEQLKSLGELKQSGVLTDAEFEAQKAKILAG